MVYFLITPRMAHEGTFSTCRDGAEDLIFPSTRAFHIDIIKYDFAFFGSQP